MDLAYVTALRRGDILKIRLSDFKNDGLHVEIGKTGKRMVFEWTSDLKEVIARVKSLKRPIKSVYLFCNRKGQKYTDDGFNSLWQRVKKRVDIEDIHFHDIRAKSLTDAKRQGRDAQLMAGHKSSSMTDHYVKQREVERVPPLKLIGGQG